jgi:CheY-like chemotaxis protein
VVHPLHQTLIEALDPLCNEEARERIFSLAAIAADAETIPTDVFEFSEYVRGPFTSAAKHVLGDDAADQLKQQLAPILMTASSGSRPNAARKRSANTKLSLVVQRKGTVRGYVVSILTEIGYEALTCEDAVQANAIIAKRHPALLCVESELPGVSATQLAAMVRRAYGDQAPAFVMVPSDGEFEPNDLLEAIDESLNRRAG